MRLGKDRKQKEIASSYETGFIDDGYCPPSDSTHFPLSNGEYITAQEIWEATPRVFETLRQNFRGEILTCEGTKFILEQMAEKVDRLFTLK